jgi:hypothetical protein
MTLSQAMSKGLNPEVPVWPRWLGYTLAIPHLKLVHVTLFSPNYSSYSTSCPSEFTFWVGIVSINYLFEDVRTFREARGSFIATLFFGEHLARASICILTLSTWYAYLGQRQRPV